MLSLMGFPCQIFDSHLTNFLAELDHYNKIICWPFCISGWDWIGLGWKSLSGNSFSAPDITLWSWNTPWWSRDTKRLKMLSVQWGYINGVGARNAYVSKNVLTNTFFCCRQDINFPSIPTLFIPVCSTSIWYLEWSDLHLGSSRTLWSVIWCNLWIWV